MSVILGHHGHARVVDPLLLGSYSSTFLALKGAVDQIYNLEDFILEPIGEGFFSEVFKVKRVAS